MTDRPDKVFVEPSTWSPLRSPTFRMLWGAYLAANLCMWMNDVAASWLMASASRDPVLVALVQTASALPMFLLALPSGAMADIVDRRRWLIGAQLWACATGSALALAAFTGLLSPPLLLGLVFANGVGFAMRWPVFSAVVADVVARRDLPQALALNSIAVNMSRILGPVAAGALLASFGGGAVFAFNAMLSLLTVGALLAWRHPHPVKALPGERFIGAMRVGVQYVTQSPSLRQVLLRVFLFFFQTTALISLLPLVAKTLGRGASGYTLLLSCVGVGAIAAGLSMSKLRRRFDLHALVNGGTAVYAVCVVLAAFAPNLWLAAIAMLPAGAAWIAVGNALLVGTQLALPDWVRARGMAIFMMSVMGGNAAGAALWGAVANLSSVQASLIVSSGFGLAVLAVLGRHRFSSEADDFTPYAFASDDLDSLPIASDAGPVVVTIAYLIDADDEAAFKTVMAESRRARLRGGALSWGLLRDVSNPRRHVEYFVDQTWTDYLRRVDRLTTGDARLRERRHALHRGDGPPVLTRHVGEAVGG